MWGRLGPPQTRGSSHLPGEEASQHRSKRDGVTDLGISDDYRRGRPRAGSGRWASLSSHLHFMFLEHPWSTYGPGTSEGI